MTTNFSKMTREQLDALQIQLSEAKQQLDQIDEMNNEVLAIAEKYGKTLNELIAIVGGSTGTSSNKEDKKYSVLLDGKEYKTSGKKLTKAITDTQTYQNLPEEQKILDTFLRAYSTEYATDFAFNASYDGNQFYMGKKGTMNAITKKYYFEYLEDQNLHESAESKASFKAYVNVA